MPIPILETCRKRKRKPNVYNLHQFGKEPLSPVNPVNRTGIFRDQIRLFLREFAEIEDYNINGISVWCTLLNYETKTTIPLYTIEENVSKTSTEPYCDHCRCTGWSNHFVSKRKYHFIIPIEETIEEDVFDIQSHILHGMIHSNGYGHLICVNGIEGGSKSLTGREIVDLWDRLCVNLGVRMVTVEDLSKKRELDLRLLYGVAYGHSWFGKWGYKFCRGSYGVTKNDYDNAIEVLGSLEIDRIEDKEIRQILKCYREMSEGQLKTFKDLLRFMLIVKCQTSPKQLPSPTPSMKRLKKNVVIDTPKDYSQVAVDLGSRWPIRRLEFAAQVVVDSLKKQNGMTRQDVRDAARLHIGDTGLLDYVLKSMNNVVVGNVLVRRYVDPLTRILHYTIDELDHHDQPVPLRTVYATNPKVKPGSDVNGDLLLLYKNVLFDYPLSETVKSATRTILDSKNYVKEWPLWDDDCKEVFRFVCRINPSLIGFKSGEVTPVGELVTVSLEATVFDLKKAIEEAFRDTYCMFSDFEVDEIDEIMEDGNGSEKLLLGRVDSGSVLTVRGFGIDIESKLKFQGGCETWMVKCICNARDDDGERMVACDVCEVWQHTRCCGIDDSDTLPPLYVCTNCVQEFADQHKKVLQPKYEFSNMLLIQPGDDYFAQSFLTEPQFIL